MFKEKPSSRIKGGTDKSQPQASCAPKQQDVTSNSALLVFQMKKRKAGKEKVCYPCSLRHHLHVPSRHTNYCLCCQTIGFLHVFMWNKWHPVVGTVNYHSALKPGAPASIFFFFPCSAPSLLQVPKPVFLTEKNFFKAITRKITWETDTRIREAQR